MAEQRIAHGATINAATPEEVAAIVVRAFEHRRPQEYRRFKGVINLDVTGAGSTRTPDIGAPPQYDLLLERVTLGGNGAPSALIGIYENQISDTDLLEIVGMGTVGKYSDSFANMLYISANSAVIIGVTGGVANGQVTYNLQGRLVKSS